MNRLIGFTALLAVMATPAFANFAITQGSGTTVLAIDASNQGTSLCAASSTECSAAVLINTAGAPIGVSGTPLFTQLAAGAANIGAVAIQASQTIGLSAGAATIGAVTQASGPWTVNLTQLDGSALGAPSNYGTSPGAVAVQGVNAFVTNASSIGTGTVSTPNIIGGSLSGTGTVAPMTTYGLDMDCNSSSNLCTILNSPIPVQTSKGNNIGAVEFLPNYTPTDCSGTITAGGTAQSMIAAQTTLHGFVVANIDAATGSGEPIWFSFTGTAAAATAASYPLSAPTATTYVGLTSWTSPAGFGTNHAVSIIGATTGHKFSCTWW